MNLKQKKARATKIFSKNIELRKELWPDITSDSLWNRKLSDGFTTMPRPMPHILQIMDCLADKGKPVSQAYLSLWCRVFDESLVVIQNEKDIAFEAGFTGQRAVTTWHSRMKNLVDMGFIEAKPGSLGKYNYVLIFNPYLVIKKFRKANKISEQLYNALFARAQDVGATDLKTGN
jgi:hypothetical protein